MSLPAEDRPLIAKALRKSRPIDFRPAERSSTRSCAGQLRRRSRLPTELPRPIPAAPRPSAPDPDDTKPPSFYTTLRRTPGQAPEPDGKMVTQPVQRGSHASSRCRQPKAPLTPEPFVPEDIVDVAVPEMNDTLAARAADSVRGCGRRGDSSALPAACTYGSAAMNRTILNNAAEAIALDTDRDELREACSESLEVAACRPTTRCICRCGCRKATTTRAKFSAG